MRALILLAPLLLAACGSVVPRQPVRAEPEFIKAAIQPGDFGYRTGARIAVCPRIILCPRVHGASLARSPGFHESAAMTWRIFALMFSGEMPCGNNTRSFMSGPMK